MNNEFLDVKVGDLVTTTKDFTEKNGYTFICQITEIDTISVKFIGLDCDATRSYSGSHNSIRKSDILRKNFEILEFINTDNVTSSSKNCTCEIFTLMCRGCQCGGI